MTTPFTAARVRRACHEQLGDHPSLEALFLAELPELMLPERVEQAFLEHIAVQADMHEADVSADAVAWVCKNFGEDTVMLSEWLGDFEPLYDRDFRSPMVVAIMGVVQDLESQTVVLNADGLLTSHQMAALIRLFDMALALMWGLGEAEAIEEKVRMKTAL